MQLKKLLSYKEHLLNFSTNEDSQKAMLLAINQLINLDRDAMIHSDEDFTMHRK